MKSDRRTFITRMLGAAAGVASAGLLGKPLRILASTANSAAGNPLRLPGEHLASEIVAQAGTQVVWPGEEIPVWTLGGAYPSPTIRVKQGDRFAMKLRNELAEPSNLHWHGLVVPEDMDGHPMDAISTGESYDYAFDVINRAGTYWYHPHPHGRSAPQIYNGMAGFFIVTDEEEERLGLPTGAFDIPLLIQDRRSAATHRFDYAATAIDHINGLLGDTILVNGTPDAYLEVSADLYRVRVLNGSNARIFKLAFAGGKRFHVIGTDGGLLDRPYDVDSVFIAPAERLELLIDFSTETVGTSFELKSIRFNNATVDRQQGFEMPVMRFDVTRSTSGTAVIPQGLRTIERLDPALAVRTQQVIALTRPGRPHGEIHLLNGKQFEMHRIDMTAGEGELEIWEIKSESDMPHPMHLHGVQFQVLERIGTVEMAPRDYGWKDTVLLWPKETVRIIMRFGPFQGTYLVHCHNLEHEDDGMMINYQIGEFIADVDEPDARPTRMDLE